ncbi:hypothetical protein LCGC14_1132680 [marine sediment metagenome]|uniref:DNA methyltransferase n=1 Tax=marine sediment metagenome TaxID=412755 RepID=A0A0F9Q6E3_9ZZZZ
MAERPLGSSRASFMRDSPDGVRCDVKKYQIIYADPPWEYKDKHNGNDNKKYNIINPTYPVMTQGDICNLGINLRSYTANNCILFMWAVFPQLKEALEVIKAWGFEYKTLGFNWVKTRNNGGYYFGIGHYTKSSSEICLIGMRGKLSEIKVSDKVHNLVVSPLRGHSRKPDEIRDKIVEFCGDKPRIELFARQKVEGWDSWGNEIESDIEL